MMDNMAFLEDLKQRNRFARIALRDGSEIIGEPFCRAEDIGPDEEDDGFTIQQTIDNRYVYVDVIESDVVTVEELDIVKP